MSKQWGHGYYTGLNSNLLCGKWFHSYVDGIIQWQGQVLSVKDDYALVQLYNWTEGVATVIKKVSLIDMESWGFYPTNDAMNEAYYKAYRK